MATIATVDRGGFIESWHEGLAVLLDADGEVVESHGDVHEQYILARSSLKPLYAAGMLAQGVVIDDERQLALACASHGRLTMHADLAREMAEALEVTEDELQCPVTELRDGGETSRFAHMCVGKHIAMVAAAKQTGDLDYRRMDHPVQQRLRETVAELTGVEPQASVADGCGAPVHSTTAVGLARAYRQLAIAGGSSVEAELLRSGDAMLHHPEIVEAPGKPDTVMGSVLTAIAKFGAEGTVAVTLPTGTTAVTHCFDGARRAATVAALDMLVRAGVIPADAVQQHAAELELVHPGAVVRSALGDRAV